MSVIKGMMLEEKERNIMMQNQYLKEISELPKGSIVKKSKKSGDYYYIAYRNGSRVVNDYLGKDIDIVNKTRQDIDKRKHLERLVKNLRSELKLIDKVVK